MIQREIKVINGKQYLCCNKCGEFKEATTDNRPKNKRGQLGLGTWCKKCMSEYAKNNKEKYRGYYYNNRDKKLGYIRKYNEEHKEEISKKRKQHYQENKELFAERNKKRYESNKDIMLQNQKEYYKNNKEKRKEYAKQYRANNKDYIKQHYIENRENYSKNRKTNEHYKEYMKRYEQEHKDNIYEMEELLNKLIKKGWKPRGEETYKPRKRNSKYIKYVDNYRVWYYILFENLQIQREYTKRELVSKESGLWQFVCKNKLYPKNRGHKRENDLGNGEIYYEDERQYYVIESALCDESELEQCLLNNIKIDD